MTRTHRARRLRRTRGVTIIEALVSLAILTIGATGMVGMHRQSQVYLGDSLRMVRATTVAQDLIAQIETWSYDDPRLANSTAANDADLGDTAYAFATQATPPADHAEADLTAGGLTWNGLPRSVLENNGMERFWNVSYTDDQNGNAVPDAVRVAVIVRWPQGAGWRRVVFMTVKPNPAEAQ